MTPGTLNLAIYQGDSFISTLRITSTLTGLPVDFTGYTGKAQIRATAISTGTLIATFTVTIADQTGLTKGCISLLLDKSITSALTPTTNMPYYWDFQLDDPSGNRRTFLRGTVTVEAEITV